MSSESPRCNHPQALASINERCDVVEICDLQATITYLLPLSILKQVLLSPSTTEVPALH